MAAYTPRHSSEQLSECDDVIDIVPSQEYDPHRVRLVSLCTNINQ